MIGILVILGFSFSAQAVTELKEITCFSKAKMKEVRKIKFENLLHEDSNVEPDSTISDASLTDWFVEQDAISMVWSNGCDNSYGIEFPRQDLEKLAKGQLKKVTGKMSYFQLTGEDDDKGNPVIIEENDLELTCLKTK